VGVADHKHHVVIGRIEQPLWGGGWCVREVVCVCVSGGGGGGERKLSGMGGGGGGEKKVGTGGTMEGKG